MTTTSINALLIEDNPRDAKLIRESLAEAEGTSINLETVSRLSTAAERLRGSHFDAIILDLNLPDSSGLKTLERVRAAELQVPVIVLTGLDDPEAGVKAVAQGAQDFISKNRLGSFSLAHTIRFAVLRHGLREQLQKVHEEVGTPASAGVGNRAGMPSIPLRAQTFGPPRLSAHQREPLVARLAQAVDLATGPQAESSCGSVTVQLRALVEELSKLQARARDVFEIYAACLRSELSDASDAKRKAWGERGAWILVELLGHLVSCYGGPRDS